jgi:cbb3-type cytochrome oxidase maturation protein
MSALAWLVPAALFLGTLALAAFLWALHSGQFDDLDGAAWRAITDDEPDQSLRRRTSKDQNSTDGPQHQI